MPASPFPVPQSNRTLTALAWAITVLVSALPDIVWAELTGSTPAWLNYGKMGLLLAVGLAALVWKPLRPLRNFCIMLFAFFGLSELRPRINFTIPGLQAFFGGSVFDTRMQAEQMGKLVVSGVMILSLLVLGYKRREFFLARGEINNQWC